MSANTYPSGQGALALTRRGRLVLFVLAALVAGLCAVMLPGLVSSATAEAPTPPAVVGVRSIAEGESLWTVAREVTEPGLDVRDTIAVIVSLNDLDSVDVRAGQQVLVPGA